MEALYIIKFIIIVFFLIFFNLTIVYLFVKKLYFTRKFKSDEELDEYYNSLEKLSKEQEEELLELVINEEVSKEQFDRFKKEKIKEEIKDLNLNEEVKERTESEKPEDIQNVNGIKEGLYSKLKEFIKVK